MPLMTALAFSKPKTRSPWMILPQACRRRVKAIVIIFQATSSPEASYQYSDVELRFGQLVLLQRRSAALMVELKYMALSIADTS